MRRPALLLASATLTGLLSSASPAGAGELAGRVTLLDAQRKASPAAGAVVWVPGVARANPFYDAAPVITQKEKRFEPHVLAVRRGTAVSFPNLDHIFHNVFSLSPGNPFDLGLYRGGDSRETRFEAPGLVRVYCNIHPQMAAYVFVMEGGAFAVTDAEGAFRIGALPAGPHAVRAWHEKGGAKEEKAEIGEGGPAELEIRLDSSAWRAAPHTRKDGRDYPPVGLDADRY